MAASDVTPYYIDATYQTYESAYCQLKPGTLVRLKCPFYGDPLNPDDTPWNICAGQHLLYLGILDTSENPRASHFIKEEGETNFSFHTFDAMHCWLNGETILCVNDLRPELFFGDLELYEQKSGVEKKSFSELDAIDIVLEPKE